MRILLFIIISGISLSVGFVIGRQTAQTGANTELNATNSQTPNTSNTGAQQATLQSLASPTSAPQISASLASAKTPNCEPTQNTLGTANKLSTTANSNTPSNAAIKTANNTKAALKFITTTELADESVDDLVPKPFNDIIKNLHGGIKQKYADFLASDEQSDINQKAENYLNDALNNGQLGNYVEINSIQCHAALCEVRAFERQPGTAIDIINKQLNAQNDYFRSTSYSINNNDKNHATLLYLLEQK